MTTLPLVSPLLPPRLSMTRQRLLVGIRRALPLATILCRTATPGRLPIEPLLGVRPILPKAVLHVALEELVPNINRNGPLFPRSTHPLHTFLWSLPPVPLPWLVDTAVLVVFPVPRLVKVAVLLIIQKLLLMTLLIGFAGLPGLPYVAKLNVSVSIVSVKNPNPPTFQKTPTKPTPITKPPLTAPRTHVWTRTKYLPRDREDSLTPGNSRPEPLRLASKPAEMD